MFGWSQVLVLIDQTPSYSWDVYCKFACICRFCLKYSNSIVLQRLRTASIRKTYPAALLLNYAFVTFVGGNAKYNGVWARSAAFLSFNERGQRPDDVCCRVVRPVSPVVPVVQRRHKWQRWHHSVLFLQPSAVIAFSWAGRIDRNAKTLPRFLPGVVVYLCVVNIHRKVRTEYWEPQEFWNLIGGGQQVTAECSLNMVLLKHNLLTEYLVDETKKF